jgi:hypothetical protein
VSGGAAKASAAGAKARRLTVTVRRRPKARGKLTVIVCPAGAEPRPCAAAKTLGKRPVKVKLGVSSRSVRVMLSRRPVREVGRRAAEGHIGPVNRWFLRRPLTA